MFRDYREKAEHLPASNAKPKRLIYYRGWYHNADISTCTDKWYSCLDGVSEGEYQKVLDVELPMIRGTHSTFT